jgi:hypothetical protein
VALTPNWQAATTGQAPQAAHINQLLGTHSIKLLYTGVLKSSQTTAGSGTTNTNGTWLAQSFTTAVGQTAVGYVILNLNSNTSQGSNLNPATVSIYANSAGAPTGSALISTTVTTEYVFDGPVGTFVPVPITGLSASTTYWIVIPAVGNSSFNYTLSKSNQVSGASTSTNGTVWTAQAYGFIYSVYDQTVSGQMLFTWEDGGLRWSWRNYNTPTNQFGQLAEFTTGQTTTGYLQSFRDFNYTTNNMWQGTF